MLFTFAILALVASSVAPAALDPRAAKGAHGPKRSVYLRVEGPKGTLYEKTVTTQAHTISTKSGSTTHCDGTFMPPPGRSGPGPTAVTALDDAGLSFDGYYYTDTPTKWKVMQFVRDLAGVKYDTNVGHWAGLIEGNDYDQYYLCGVALKEHDHVLWAYISSGYTPDQAKYLKLAGPKTAKVGQTVTFSISGGAPAGSYLDDKTTDGATNAKVRATIDASGNAKITFAKKGTYDLKAHCPSGAKACIRSNHLKVVVS